MNTLGMEINRCRAYDRPVDEEKQFMNTPPQGNQNHLCLVPPNTEKCACWGIVFAADEDNQRGSLINRISADNPPQQHFAYVSKRSLFQHSIGCVRSLVHDSRLITVLRGTPGGFRADLPADDVPGKTIEEPCDVGSAPAVLLPTAYVLAADPEALVAFFTPNLFVSLKDRFYHHVCRAYETAEALHNQIVLLATVSDPSETDSWEIEPKRTRECARVGNTSHNLLKMVCFPEQRAGGASDPRFRQDCLWRTVGMVVPAKTLWSLAKQCLPEMMYWFDAFLKVLNAINAGQIGPEREEVALVRLYEELFVADLWRDIVKHVADCVMLLPMEDMDWMDWERARRVTKTVARLNCGPLFASQPLEQAFESLSAVECSSRVSRENRA